MKQLISGFKNKTATLGRGAGVLVLVEDRFCGLQVSMAPVGKFGKGEIRATYARVTLDDNMLTAPDLRLLRAHVHLGGNMFDGSRPAVVVARAATVRGTTARLVKAALTYLAGMAHDRPRATEVTQWTRSRCRCSTTPIPSTWPSPA